MQDMVNIEILEKIDNQLQDQIYAREEKIKDQQGAIIT